MVNQLSPLEALSYVQQQGEIGRERGQRNQLAQLYSQTYTAPAEQQNALLGQMAAISPQAAQATQQQFQGQEDRRNRTLANMANLLVNSPVQARPALYQKMLPSLQQFGVQAPEAYDESTAPLIDQTAQALYRAFNGGDANAMAPRVVGNALVDARGKVLYEAPQKQDYQWSERAGAWIPKPGQVPQAAPAAGTPYTLGADLTPEQREAAIADAQNNGAADQYTLPQRPAGGLAAIPVAGIEPKPEVSPIELRRLQLQEEANARSAAADRRAEAAASRAAQATPNASEDERKAAGWFGQATRALSNMRSALAADPEADTPGIIETYSPSAELANRSRSPERQRYAQAASSLAEALLRAATGAGVNESEARQKIAEVTPQRGDSAEVKAQKMAAAEGYLQDLQARAGRALRQAPAQGAVMSRQVVRTGTLPDGRKVVQYSDGTTDYGN